MGNEHSQFAARERGNQTPYSRHCDAPLGVAICVDDLGKENKVTGLIDSSSDSLKY
jgi:hypothetical protein